MFAFVALILVFVIIPVVGDLLWRADVRRTRQLMERSHACCDAILDSPMTGFFRAICSRRAMFHLTGRGDPGHRCHEHVGWRAQS